MSTKIIEGVEYIAEEIPGRGICLVPKRSITEKDIVPGAEFTSSNGGGTQLCLIETYNNKWLLGGSGNNKFRLYSDKHSEGGHTKPELIEKLISLKAKKV